MLCASQQLALTVQYLEHSLLLLVTWASDVPLRMPLCCLRRKVVASCHKHFVVVSREKQTTSLTSD